MRLDNIIDVDACACRSTGIRLMCCSPWLWCKTTTTQPPLKTSRVGFVRTVPNRTPPPETLEEINAGYKRLGRYIAVFDYPRGDPGEEDMQLYLFPNSFTHVPLEDIPRHSNEIRYTTTTKEFDTYGNLHYSLEQALGESFVKAAVDEIKADTDADIFSVGGASEVLGSNDDGIPGGR
ncbi:hypothetical protein BGW36DRAFT_364923 [Talaromyces proteolyticus]|uniref:Uncharacterized protein n=1 Tax=Talaromyces proteolyticus TaxID=1131652 RepID=A0AAD4KIL6_9EURO|nr:uncharacterized protein BGW36DRAFT_364923 [Talaromyces proteolyticus]KAH8690200.1 hypothetical protein BGW36DRAFT_364923 [Talaromyces proteolyticus]